jgi:hypothetical protein
MQFYPSLPGIEGILWRLLVGRTAQEGDLMTHLDEPSRILVGSGTARTRRSGEMLNYIQNPQKLLLPQSPVKPRLQELFVKG